MLIQSLLCTVYCFYTVSSFDVDTFSIIKEDDTCTLDPKLIKEISSYQPIVNNILKELTNGPHKGKTYEALAEFVDRFGPRISGSSALENAIDYMLHKSLKNNFSRVYSESVEVPHWVRGRESAVATFVPYKRDKKLSILALGGSVGTPKGGLKAEAIVVRTFAELHQQGNKAAGKIVVFAPKWVSYGETVKYRQYGAVETAKVGGIASLIRSVTPFSINSPHTGWQDYDDKIVKIPTACITVEDAEMLLRLYRRGVKIEILLEMEMQNLPPTTSRNTVIETIGRSNPYDIVLLSGHLDSWDVGNGAMDDGGGAFISWYSSLILKSLGLTPRRTIRSVLWTGEEEGLLGATEYRRAHSKEMKNFTLLMESDIGTFNPLGITFKGSKEAQCIMQEIVKGKERAVATLVPYGRDQELSILALGGSVGTPIGGLKAEAIVVRSFDELRQMANETAGKIIVFAPEWVNYNVTVNYRTHGAVEAAKVGGIASLIRSVTPFSIYSPHTGLQKYDEKVVKIPTASITVEDAEMLLRLYRKGVKVEIFLEMEMQNLPPTISRNTVIDIMGISNPYDIVLISGHLDSWDVGNGALDDGGGAFISWYSALLLKNLGLIPKRTIRTVLWTGEEEGYLGAIEYRRAHFKEKDNITLLMESDIGSFDPQGISFKGSTKAQCLMQEILKLFSALNATQLESLDDFGTDIMAWKDDGIPMASLKNDDERYFWFHHSKGDTLTVESPDSLDKCTAVWASIAYVVADLSVKFPR